MWLVPCDVERRDVVQCDDTVSSDELVGRVKVCALIWRSYWALHCFQGGVGACLLSMRNGTCLIDRLPD